jgi:hypothetical protein
MAARQCSGVRWRWQWRPARGRRKVRGWARLAGRQRPKRSGGGLAVRADWAKKVGWADLAAQLKQRNKSFLNFKLNFGIWLDFGNLFQEI